MKKTQCDYCDHSFVPDPRVGNRQKACPKKSCQKKRHAKAHAKWFEKNPNAYRGRYPNTKTWLSKHPNFLSNYRAEHPDYVEADNQRHRERRKEKKRRNADIQDEMRLKITGILELLDVWPTHPRADIQDSMAPSRVAVAGSAP